MAEDLQINNNWTVAERYEYIITSALALVEGEENLIANLANLAAVLHEVLGHFWTGFYLVEGQELVLGPFQGPVACTRIPFGKGVCGTVAIQKKTILVADVTAFPGHIACSSQSKSEIVVPVFRGGQLIAVLDIDSTSRNTFTQNDAAQLEAMFEKCNI